MRKFKDFTVTYKADGDFNGKICGYFSTWTKTPDAYGDIVKQGAFQNSFKRIADDNITVPFLFSHQIDNLDAYLGKVTLLKEDEHGAYFEAELDDSPQAQKVRNLFLDGRLNKFSFAYTVIDEGPVTLENNIKANELRELDLYEVSAVLIPANPDVSVTEVKAGKRNSLKDETTIKEAIKLLQELLGELAEDEIEQEIDKVNSEKDAGDNAGQAKDQEQLNEKKNQLLDLIKKITIE